MEEHFIYYADLFGTVIFAITGAMRGIGRRLDLFGVIVLACTVGVGGGLCRDCALGALPAAALTNEVYLLLCIITAIIVFMLPHLHIQGKISEIIVYCDAIGLGVFTSLGAQKAIQYGMPPVTIVLSGLITAIGGGMIRDVLVGSIPTVLKSDFYATASLLGGLLYLFLHWTGLPFFSTFLIVSAVVMGSRLLAYRFKVQLPKAE